MPLGQNIVLQSFPPMFNGQQLQFANIQLAIEGIYFPFIQEVEYQDSVDVEEGRGTSPYPMGTTTGSYKASGSLSVLLAHREAFLSIISRLSPSKNSIYDAVWTAQAQWQHRAGPNQVQPPVFMDELIGCRLISSGVTGSSGPGVMVVKYGLNVQLIRHNGRLPLAGLPF